MLQARRLAMMMLCTSAALAIGCGRPESGANRTSAKTNDDGRLLNLYIWSDYLAPDTIATFEKQTGIKVRVSYFDTNETLESRVLTGSSGFDVVVPTAPFLQRQIRSGAYQKLDKQQLPNFTNLDPQLMSQVALNDPGNEHAIVYAWGTFGIGYNEKMVAAALPSMAPDSWRLIFDPAVAAKLAACGIGVLDEPTGVVRLVLNYLGKDPNELNAQNLAQIERVLIGIRPYVRNINSSSYIEALANGDICVALGFNGDVIQARNRANEANNGIKIDYAIPKEGSEVWFDTLAIPRDAPHSANAHRFINYILSPQVIADISNFTGFANANAAATPLLKASIASDPAVYPPQQQRQRLFVQLEDAPEQTRAITRLWQKFKTGQ